MLAAHLERSDILALTGELGAGKTQFVKGVCEAFGVREHIASPTFVILNRYTGRDQQGRELLLFHLDLYRVKSLEEIYDIGFEEFFYGDGIVMIEWAELLQDLLPARRYDIRLLLGSNENERLIEIERREDSAIQPHVRERARA